jgi:ubiquinol-cytochrome c reductase cytochrome b subunit
VSTDTAAESAPAAIEDFQPTTWTGSIRKKWLTTLPPEKMLPENQPAYVASWIYVFGMLTITALIVVIASGCILTIGGIQWFHESSTGHFVNSLHFWSVQLFFLFMIVHLWGKFWMAAWRGKRGLTWATGAICFLASLGTAFTGYTITTNFNAQWIAFESKDVMNAVGLGSWINVTNLGQMVLLHVCMLPLAVVAVVAMHVLLVRKHGVVPPIDALDPQAAVIASAAPSHSADTRSADTGEAATGSGAADATAGGVSS